MLGFKKSLIKRNVKLIILSITLNFFGFLIPVFIANRYGVTIETDAFFLSYGIISFISIIFSGALRSVIVPFIIEKELISKTTLNSFLSSIIRYVGIWGLVFSLTFSIICFWLFNYLNKDIFLFLSISSPIILLSVINSFLIGILNSKNKFFLSEFVLLTRIIAIYLVVYLTINSIGIISVLLGYLLGELFKCFHLIFIVRKLNYYNFKILQVDYSTIKDFIFTGGKQVLSTAIASASPLVDKLVASFWIVGGVSLLDYSERIYIIFVVILNVFLVQLLSKFSINIVSSNFNYKQFKKLIIVILIFTTLMFLIFLVFRYEIVNLVYNNLLPDDKYLISWLLALNMFSFIFYSSNQVVNRATIAIKCTNILVKVAVLKLFINIIFDILLIYYFGIIGLAISTVVVNISGFIYNYFLFRKQIKIFYENRSFVTKP